MLLRKTWSAQLRKASSRFADSQRGCVRGWCCSRPHNWILRPTLGFASLCHSFMQVHNLCYTTILLASGSSPPAVPSGDSVEDVPGAVHRFVASQVCHGILPLFPEELLPARASAVRAMKSAEGNVKVMLKGRHLALKLSANSVCGFTGMVFWALCHVWQSPPRSHRTGGGWLIAQQEVVEGTLCKAHGLEEDAKVTCRDTDSDKAFGRVETTLGRTSRHVFVKVGCHRCRHR